MLLSKETKGRIRKQANHEYNAITDSSAFDFEKGYIAGAEAEAERAQGLVSALETALADRNLSNHGDIPSHSVMWIKEALIKYNNNKQNP